jgi:hypothetical protein
MSASAASGSGGPLESGVTTVTGRHCRVAAYLNQGLEGSAEQRCCSVPAALRAPAPPQPQRVCQAWHRTRRVQVPMPGIGGAEG